MKKILFILSIAIVSCNNKGKIVKTETENKADTVSRIINQPKVENEGISQVYQVENDTLFQQVELKNIVKNKVNFIIISKDKIQNTTEKIEGIALVSNSSDIEFEEDEEGNAIPVTEYLYKKGNCWMSLRIDSEKGYFLKLKETDCNIFNKGNTLNTGIFLVKK